MSEWKEYNITEVCDTISDTYRDSAEKVVLINTSDVLEGKVTNHEFVPNKNLAGQFKKKFQKDDILYSEIRPANKRYAYVDFEPKDYIASTKLMVLRSKPCILPKYLYYLLTNNTTIHNLHAIAIGRSGTFPQITYSELANIKFRLPFVDEQKEILSTLLNFDEKIAVNKKICENLEAQAQALFKHWFVDFAPFKDGKFVESELGLIPEGWRVGTLGDICITNKRTYGSSSLGIIEYIDTGSVTNNKIDNIQILDPKIDKIPSRARRAITEGDILFSSVRPNQRHFAFMYNPNSRMVASTGFVVITANWNGYQYYIYQYLIQDSVINYLQAIAEQSVSTYPSINASDITNIKIIIPPDDIIRDYATILSRFMGEINRNNQESSRLAILRDTLLPKLMSGQIKVNEYE